jgi:hypothetical protein
MSNLHPIDFGKFMQDNPDLTAKLTERQNNSPIKIYEGHDWAYHANPDEHFGSIYAARPNSEGNGHDVLGYIRYSLKNGAAHIQTHPDLSSSEIGLMTFSMGRVAHEKSLARTGNPLSTDVLTTPEGHRLLAQISGIPKDVLDQERSKRLDEVRKDKDFYSVSRMLKGMPASERREDLQSRTSEDLTRFPGKPPKAILFK